MPVWSLAIALIAVAISITSLVWNRLHSESLFRRTQYPAVAWYQPEISKIEHNTAIKTSICNHGQRDIASISLGAFLCRGFKSEAWCKSKLINEIPIKEDLKITITEELEEDINERFGGLVYRDGWQFTERPKKYKTIFRLEYLPLIADTSHVVRKGYYLIKPVIENGIIQTWELKSIPTWQSWFPWF